MISYIQGQALNDSTVPVFAALTQREVNIFGILYHKP